MASGRSVIGPPAAGAPGWPADPASPCGRFRPMAGVPRLSVAGTGTGPGSAQSGTKMDLITYKAQVGAAGFPGARACSPRAVHAGWKPALPGGPRSLEGGDPGNPVLPT